MFVSAHLQEGAMKSRYGLLLFLLFAFALVAWTQATPKTPPPKYDTAQEKTLNGVVEEVKEYTCPVSGGLGGHFVVQTPDGKFEVHLATTKFLKEYGMNFAKGDKVQVVGAPATLHESVSIMARKVERGNDVFFFRDPKGRPLW
jgi:hypothetical protein